MRQRRLLRRARVAQQRAGGADGERRIGDAERREILRAELPRERLRGRGCVEVPRRAARGNGARPRSARRRRVVGVQHLGGFDPFERRGRFVRGDVGQRDPPGREVEPGHTRALAAH